MNKQRRATPPPPLTPQAFIVQMQQALDKLMVGFMKDFETAGVEFDEDETDELITLIVNQWCEKETPDYELNLKMCAAVYLSSVLDCMYGEEDEPEKQPLQGKPRNDNSQHKSPAVELGLDLLKTVRSVFGKEVT